MKRVRFNLIKKLSWTELLHRSLLPLLWIYLFSTPHSLYSQDTLELDNIKKVSLSIREDNVVIFTFKDSAPELLPPRTYKKTISNAEDFFLVSYGLGVNAQPTLSIQLKSSPSPAVLIEFAQQKISMTPGASITIKIGETAENTTLTPSLLGVIKLNQRHLPPGLPLSLGIPKIPPTPAPPKESPLSIPKIPLKPRKSNPPPAESIPQNPAATTPRATTTIKSIERRKILIEALRESAQKQTPLAKKESESSTLPQKSAPIIREITVQQNPDEEPFLIRENQILLQLSTGLQNIIDQITNNPLSADDTFNLGLPPLPPPATKPPLASFNEWIAKLQSDNSAYRQKAIKNRAQLTQFLSTLTKPSFQLSPLIPANIEEEARLASKAYKHQDWNTAADHYLKALKVEPTSLHLLSNLGVVYFSLGDYEAAEKILLQTVRQAPHDSFSYSILGICYLQTEQLEKSINALLLSVNMNPQDAQSQNYLAMTLTKKGWITAAEEHGRQSIRLNPNYSEAHYNLAQIYADQKPIARELAKKHYHLSVNLGGTRDEKLETLLQIEAKKIISSEPQIQVNPPTP